jgi:hypothetical protein
MKLTHKLTEAGEAPQDLHMDGPPARRDHGTREYPDTMPQAADRCGSRSYARITHDGKAFDSQVGF